MTYAIQSVRTGQRMQKKHDIHGLIAGTENSSKPDEDIDTEVEHMINHEKSVSGFIPPGDTPEPPMRDNAQFW